MLDRFVECNCRRRLAGREFAERGEHSTVHCTSVIEEHPDDFPYICSLLSGNWGSVVVCGELDLLTVYYGLEVERRVSRLGRSNNVEVFECGLNVARHAQSDDGCRAVIRDCHAEVF